jgi:hypothetical protein
MRHSLSDWVFNIFIYFLMIPIIIISEIRWYLKKDIDKN